MESAEASLSPLALRARTENVYDVPLLRPPTVHDVVAVLQVAPPGEALTE